MTTFRTTMPLEQTMDFEAVYEPELQMDLASKRETIAGGIAVWMFVDGVLAGETYGVAREPGECYCYSTTLLPAFQGRGLGKILCAYWLGLVRAAGYRRVAGHTTSDAMTALKASFGAVFSTVHERWYGTERTAHFYVLDLEGP